MNANQLTGSIAQQARTNIGLSLLSASKITGINRNQLSQFESEKGRLSAPEKTKLINCYLERGYGFEDVEELDDETALDMHEDVKSNVVAQLTERFSGELVDLLSEFMDSHDNTLSVLSAPKTETEEAPEAIKNPEFDKLESELVAHFKADKNGDIQVSTGFLGESNSARREKLTGLLALQYLRSLNIKHPNLINLSLKESVSGSDNYRALDCIDDCLAHEELKEFSHIMNDVVA